MNKGNNMDYSKAELISKCHTAMADVSEFYKEKFVNYQGRTSDTDELYTEVISGFVHENLDKFHSIKGITRNASYELAGHDCSFSIGSNREEEIIAMKICRQSRNGEVFPGIGIVLDYQVPLKNRREDKAGKVDLISLNEDNLYLLELKRQDSNETMLRCVLEGFTYLKTVDQDKLVSDFRLSGVKSVNAAPLVFEKSRQWMEMREERPNLKNLMNAMKIKPFYLKELSGNC